MNNLIRQSIPAALPGENAVDVKLTLRQTSSNPGVITL